ncbi:helix-turn-helix domain-containing protein [Rossellomorea sp. NPDC071047]|uniref:helix-turn-helix domain-containing protein n=1 Tax=Rossellomorea sp. NPDC071047 TaxID=3390675 RepID=UPI003D02D123
MLIWNLDQLLQERNMSAADLSQLSGVHTNVLSRIRTNKQRRVDLDVLERISDSLDVSIGKLIIKKESMK